VGEMSYCPKCGAKMEDNATICPSCGYNLREEPNVEAVKSNGNESLQLVAKVFMIISTVLTGIYIIPLLWTIPMTVHYFTSCKEKRPVGIGFKVCTLIFVSLIAGILMLVDNQD
jgi:uncharacterized membrane protein YvbJ